MEEKKENDENSEKKQEEQNDSAKTKTLVSVLARTDRVTVAIADFTKVKTLAEVRSCVQNFVDSETLEDLVEKELTWAAVFAKSPRRCGK